MVHDPNSDVTIVITRMTQPLTQFGFGLPLLFGTGVDVPYTLCADIAAVEEAGFAVGTDVYKMAQAIFAQSPRPERVAIFGVNLEAEGDEASVTIENAAGTASLTITPDSEGALAKSKGNGVKVVFVDSGGGGLSASYAGGTLTIDVGDATPTFASIAAEIDGTTGFADTVVTGGEVEFTKDDLAVTGTLEGGYDDLAGGMVVALNRLMRSRSDWYFLLTDQGGPDEIKAVSAWVAANQRLYFVRPNLSVANTVILAGQLASERTAIMWHDDPDLHPEAAWVGKCAPYLPGQITWKFKTLTGIAAAEVSSTQLADLHAANCNTYLSKYGVLQTSEGMTTGNEFIDVIRSQDFVEARLAEGISRLLFLSPKVPYDSRGIALVVAEVEAVMQLAVRQGIIAVDDDGNGEYTVTAPEILDIPVNDRANRHLPDVYFDFRLAGAIHTVRVQGVIRV